MKIVVTGAKGQLGTDLVVELRNRAHTVIGLDVDEMDITDTDSVRRILSDINPDAVIHCAAWTAVDNAEDPENLEKVYAINAKGTENIAKMCGELSCKMIYLSTDYVFNGKGDRPFDPDSSDYCPQNVYGQSKRAGEEAVQRLVKSFYIVRTAWVFGVHGNNFVKTMLRLGKTHPEIRVVNDQIGTPTYTVDLSVILADMVAAEQYGYYHVTNEGGYISWFDFTMEIFRQAAERDPAYHNVRVIPVSTSEYGASKAHRPLNSRLDKSKLTRMGFHRLPDWTDALSRYLYEMEKENGTNQR